MYLGICILLGVSAHMKGVIRAARVGKMTARGYHSLSESSLTGHIEPL